MELKKKGGGFNEKEKVVNLKIFANLKDRCNRFYLIRVLGRLEYFQRKNILCYDFPLKQ